MARISDLNLRYRLFMRTYKYRSVDWTPGIPLKSELHRSKLAVVTTAAFYCPDQPPFDEELKGGDTSFREIPNEADLPSLRIGHRSDAFDYRGIQSDANLAFPLDRLRELVAEGFLGDINHRHFSFMGSMTAPGRLITRSAPEVAELLLADRVDAVLLTPV